MKHIRKVVSISYALSKLTDWSRDEINAFISQMNEYEQTLSRFNELLMNNKNERFEEGREALKEKILDYIIRDMNFDINMVFSHDVRSPAILMKLGKPFANHSDDESFVIDL